MADSSPDSPQASPESQDLPADVKAQSKAAAAGIEGAPRGTQQDVDQGRSGDLSPPHTPIARMDAPDQYGPAPTAPEVQPTYLERTIEQLRGCLGIQQEMESPRPAIGDDWH